MAGVAQLGEQQTEASQETRLLRLRSNLEVPCSIHGPGIFFQLLKSETAKYARNTLQENVRIFGTIYVLGDARRLTDADD